ncbi:MAG: DnaJ domain-containing protein [Deltaproteobacteria bacterium]|jgi:tetratricopeptide (TPR) repeat protein|nr:DnaJ domain-containing protein [Deltaproteobacteria bacterium]
MSAEPCPRSATPEEGALETIPVAQLLAEAWRDRRSGCLRLSHGQTERRIHVQDGAPVSAEAPLREDRLAEALHEAGLITLPDRRRVEKLAAERERPQASIALALELVEAGVLYKAMRDRERTLMVESLEWRQGNYRWEPSEERKAKPAKAFDLPSLLQSQLPRRWGSERLFESLMPESQRFAQIVPRFRRVARRLSDSDPQAARALARLDGSAALGQVLGECAGDPMAAATLWTVLHLGGLRLSDEPVRHAARTESEIEVQVDASSAAAGAGRAGALAAGSTTPSGGDPKGEAMREEIQTLLGQLSALGHYSALGLDSGTSAADIKKAYFKAAKKYHPDALARLGLGDLRDAAARVFARISEAFETLSDADRRAAYDSGAGEPAEIDTASLAQAEQSYRKGEILVRMGNFAAALEYLESAVELWPDEPAYQAGLGWALYKKPRSEPERARKHLQIARQQAPEDAQVLFRLGVVLRDVGEREEADQLLARARALDSSIEG